MSPDDTRLPRTFFARPSVEVAPDLLGRHLSFGGVVLRLTELEAYAGEVDPGSHAFRGETPRTRPMFGPPGFTYVYFTYGHHWCVNLVVGAGGRRPRRCSCVPARSWPAATSSGRDVGPCVSGTGPAARAGSGRRSP